MYSIDFNNLLKKKMTRKEFLRASGILFISAFGVAGAIKELASHAATPGASLEAENGTVSGNAQVITDNSASGDEAIQFGSGTSSTASYITGLSPSGSGNLNWFVDQNGKPRFMLFDNPWALVPNAGRWNGSGGGTWQEDIDNYCTGRGAQGFAAVYLDPLGNIENNGKYANGRTWDGVTPFVGSTPDTGLNNTFWTRVDRLISDCAAQGMTVWLNIGYTGGGGTDLDSGGCLTGLTAAQYNAWGANLAARYKSTPNIIWGMGNDYGSFGEGGAGGADTQMQEILNGIRNAGDTHLFTLHPYVESDSRYDFGAGTAGVVSDTFGLDNAQFSMVYTYIQTYYGVEYAYGTEKSPIPIIWGDGYFYNGADPTYDTAMRQDAWWAIASGARGCNTTSEDIWQWDSGSPAAVTQGLWYTQQAAVIPSLLESLPNWYKLVPDTSNQLITAGRGTHCAETSSGGGGRQWGTATNDNYVTASYVADGSLALIYFSAGCGSNTITIDQSKLKSGYTATWVDPTNGNKYNATPSSTYSAGTAHGKNAAGYADWVLVLQG